MLNEIELKCARMRRHVSAKDLAKSIGITDSCYYKKENGESPLKLNEIEKITKYLHLNMIEFFAVFFDNEIGEDFFTQNEL